MRLSTGILFLVGAVYLARILYVPMPTDMDSKLEFYWKTVGFRFCRSIMYLEYLFRGGSTIDFSVIQTGLNILTYTYQAGQAFAPNSKVIRKEMSMGGVDVFFYEHVDGKRENRPAFIFVHGGGMVVGNIDIYDAGTREISMGLEDTVVISVDYRLAPENPFPAGFEDGLTVTKWLLNHASEYGVDPTRVGVGGDSAGGYLTAAIVQDINDDQTLPNISLQVLIFPWLQVFDFQTPSYQKNGYLFGDRTWLPNDMPGFCFSAYFNGVLNDSLVKQFTSNNHTSPEFKNSPFYRRTFNHSLIPESFRDPAYYTQPKFTDFGDEALWNDLKDALLDQRFSPIVRADMTGLPRAYIVTAGYDPLRDDGIFYYHRLKEAGVDVQWVNYEMAFHGIDWFGPAQSKTGQQVQKGFVTFIKDNL